MMEIVWDSINNKHYNLLTYFYFLEQIISKAVEFYGTMTLYYFPQPCAYFPLFQEKLKGVEDFLIGKWMRMKR